MLEFNNVELNIKSVLEKLFNEYEITNINGIKIIKYKNDTIELNKFIDVVNYVLNVPDLIYNNGFDSIDGLYEHTNYYYRHTTDKSKCIYNDIRIIRKDFELLITGNPESEVPYKIHYLCIYDNDLDLNKMNIKPEIEFADNNFEEKLFSHGKNKR